MHREPGALERAQKTRSEQTQCKNAGGSVSAKLLGGVCPSPFHASLRWILGCWPAPRPPSGSERRRRRATAPLRTCVCCMAAAEGCQQEAAVDKSAIASRLRPQTEGAPKCGPTDSSALSESQECHRPSRRPPGTRVRRRPLVLTRIFASYGARAVFPI